MDLPNPSLFYSAVWALVRQVPYGRVVTYGQVAQLIDKPAEVDDEDYRVYGPRWVGEAMAASPADVPWQRVINAQGKISDRPGAKKQRELLEREGVLFLKDRVDLKIDQWSGPGQDGPPRQQRLF